MTNHITVRLAWHNDGWDGHICKNPKENTYCIGRHSYPGDVISTERDLEWEQSCAGKSCASIDGIPACAFSINAFGKETIKAYSDPPEWYRDGSKGIYINLPPSSVCIWPYEGMYSDDVTNLATNGQKYNGNQRFKNASDYFNKLEPNKSLIFYYANYSNPFSGEDNPKYVVVGISRLKSVGDFQYYENVSERVKEKYANGMVWQRVVTSNYPDEGFRIPYEKYMDNPEILERILFVPENPRNFKYATRHVSNDDALTLVERMIEIVNTLIEISDTTQNWEERRNWLYGLLSELWKHRGCYPGFTEVLRYIDLHEGIEYYRNQTLLGNELEAYTLISDFIKGKSKELQDSDMSTRRVKEFQRGWKLQEDEEQQLLLEILPRFDIGLQQIKNILNPNRDKNNLSATLVEIIENPYILSEQYIGDEMDDYISFNKVDNGILPSPELGIDHLMSKNSAERFRALCVSAIQRDSVHSFVLANRILDNINRKLESNSDWKRHQFVMKNFIVDEEVIEEAIVMRKDNEKLYLYLKEVYEDERLIENTIRELTKRRDISLRVPATAEKFYDSLIDTSSVLNQKAPSEYDAALKGQADVCVKVFNKPVCVISGAAGTGKTTIIRSIIQMIEKVHGVGTNILLMAPTGKATERIKDKAQKPSSTIHSFLAKNGWLNDNFTYKRDAGKVETDIQTIIIDECSMIDLHLFAALFRAIKWTNVQRLILIGDPNQLPPIGRGKVFSDIINWLRETDPENLGKLDVNVRQLENKVSNKGNGILDLAEIFIQEKQQEKDSKFDMEDVIKKVQEGGEIDKDLSVYYWNNEDELETLLQRIIIRDLENDTGQEAEEGKEYYLWGNACSKNSDSKDPAYLQVLSPFKGELYGTDNLNLMLQKLFNGYWISKNQIDGISLFDKVIQYRNRPKSDPIFAYDISTKTGKYVEVYNGEIGFVKPHPFDKGEYKKPYFRLEKFQTQFKGKEHLWIGYGKKLGKDNADKWIREQKPEDNLELAYAISVHKAQGSEFDRVYFVLPKRTSSLLSMELLYTAITRAQRHFTIFIQEDVSTLLSLRRIERSNIRRINSSLFNFEPIPEEFLHFTGWYEENKVISTLTQYLVRSKSEMNIANILFLNNIDFKYEEPLFAKDGSMYLPDFTLNWHGENYYWEHVGRLDLPDYQKKWEEKKKWYNKHFQGKLITTFEGNNQTLEIKKILKEQFDIEINE
ncbi:ATP-dependent DNA helicase [Bacillus massilinigeriensis]|uniref:ATP-dependent DNA helicase n=1 Tax=Bacillus massilionigeriensis TaxID=1805475 RepID=UPI00096B1108|nr:ATP-dependent RecD-like DNA helicase [Bacillus massilionigeriensis]